MSRYCLSHIARVSLVEEFLYVWSSITLDDISAISEYVNLILLLERLLTNSVSILSLCILVM